MFTVHNRGRGEALRLRLGLSIRRLAIASGIPYHRVYRIMRRGWPPRRSESTSIAHALDDHLRLRLSSDPALLSAIQRVAIPFLLRCHPERSEVRQPTDRRSIRVHPRLPASGGFICG